MLGLLLTYRGCLVVEYIAHCCDVVFGLSEMLFGDSILLFSWYFGIHRLVGYTD